MTNGMTHALDRAGAEAIREERSMATTPGTLVDVLEVEQCDQFVDGALFHPGMVARPCSVGLA